MIDFDGQFLSGKDFINSEPSCSDGYGHINILIFIKNSINQILHALYLLSFYFDFSCYRFINMSKKTLHSKSFNKSTKKLNNKKNELCINENMSVRENVSKSLCPSRIKLADLSPEEKLKIGELIKAL